MKTPVAIRSLMCADHAYHIPPQVFSVNWFLGKRCNYDCSYCPPHIHDAVSPFIDTKSAKKFIDSLRQVKPQIKWNFTGGEPFIDPGLRDIIVYLRSYSTSEQINSTTNGSLPLKTYSQLADCFTGLTFSLHLERSDAEINKTLKTLKDLSISFPALQLTVNLMFLPGKLKQTQNLVAWLQENTINFIVRKIHPPMNADNLVPFRTLGSGKKDRALLPINRQKEYKIKFVQQNNQARSSNMLDYYTTEELKYLELFNDRLSWINMGVWFEDGQYQELNSDQLITHEKHSFKNWICYAGVDNIFIDFDGSVYRGNCLNNGNIGSIFDEFEPQLVPTKCKRQWCSCNADIPIRKVQKKSYLGLINARNE
jgi:MoaA/NifB/PqqE/SkfB family radical SAM enzyme